MASSATTYRTGRHLPCIYEDTLDSARMLHEQRPYKIGFFDLFAVNPEPMHWHDAFEIGFVTAGEGILALEEYDYPLRPGSVYVVNSASRHIGYAVDMMRLFVVHFHPSLLHDSSFPTLGIAAQHPFAHDIRRFPALLPSEHPATARIFALLTSIAEEYHDAASGWEVVTKGCLLQIAGLLLRHFVAHDDPDPAMVQREALLRRITPALQLLERQIDDPPSLEELAATISVHPNYFCSMFRAATGMSPVAYRHRRRITLAQQLLSEGDEPVTQIAERCGFGAVQQFNRVFRRLVGCTPREYRLRARTVAASLAST